MSQDARRVRTSAKVRPREAHDVGVGATVRVPDARAPRRRLRGVRPGVPRATVLENLDALGKDRESTFGDVAAGGGLPETLHAHAKPGDDGLGHEPLAHEGDARFVRLVALQVDEGQALRKRPTFPHRPDDRRRRWRGLAAHLARRRRAPATTAPATADNSSFESTTRGVVL